MLIGSFKGRSQRKEDLMEESISWLIAAIISGKDPSLSSLISPWKANLMSMENGRISKKLSRPILCTVVKM